MKKEEKNPATSVDHSRMKRGQVCKKTCKICIVSLFLPRLLFWVWKFQRESFAVTSIWAFPFSCYTPSPCGVSVEKVKAYSTSFVRHSTSVRSRILESGADISQTCETANIAEHCFCKRTFLVSARYEFLALISF